MDQSKLKAARVQACFMVGPTIVVCMTKKRHVCTGTPRLGWEPTCPSHASVHRDFSSAHEFGLPLCLLHLLCVDFINPVLPSLLCNPVPLLCHPLPFLCSSTVVVLSHGSRPSCLRKSAKPSQFVWQILFHLSTGSLCALRAKGCCCCSSD